VSRADIGNEIGKVILNGIISYAFFLALSLTAFLLTEDGLRELLSRRGFSSLFSSPWCNLSLWFLVVLTEVKVIYLLAGSFFDFRNRYLLVPLIVICTFLAMVSSYLWPGGRIVPGMLGAIPLCGLFYGIGLLVSEKVRRFSMSGIILYCLPCIALVVLLPARIDFRYGVYPMWYLPLTMGLIFGVLALAGKISKRNTGLSYVGRHSLYFFAMEVPVRTCLAGIFGLFGIRIPLYPWRENLSVSLMIFLLLSEVLILCVTVPVIKRIHSALQERFSRNFESDI